MPNTLTSYLRSEILRVTRRRYERGLDALRGDVKALRAEIRRLATTIERLAHRPTRPSKPSSGATWRPTAADIRASRSALGLSRKAFAHRLGVSQSIVYMWEAGRSVPKRAAILQRLRRSLHGPRASKKSGNANGRSIRALRDSLGLSRAAFAKRLRVSPGAVYLWESGRSAPTRPGTLKRLQQLHQARGDRLKH